MATPKGFGHLAINLIRPDWRSEIPVHNTDRYKEKLASVEWQGNERCYFCGFPDGHFLEIHHLNHDHEDYNNGNLVPCCSLCHRLHHLSWVGMKSMGQLLHLPSIESDDDDFPASPPFSLEVVSLINRFYLMQEVFTDEQKRKLKMLPISQVIDSILSTFQFVDFHTVLINRMKQSTELKNLQEQYAQATGEEKEKINKQISDFKKKLREENTSNATTSKMQNLAANPELSIEKKREELDNLNAAKEAISSTSYLGGDISIIDLAILLAQIDRQYKDNELTGFTINPCDKWFDEQKAGQHGRTTVWFNSSVYEPIFPEQNYTWEERMNYYKNLDYFNPAQMQNIMQSLLIQGG